jgi:precorrin-6B C5,15-methyltransferase / cobalt-precorrin-6B C5,C15-methyltransferase
MGELSVITVIGLDGSPLSRRAARAVADATLLVGARRHLAAAGWPPEVPGRVTAPSPSGAAAVSPDGPYPTSTDSAGISPRPAPAPATRPAVVVMGPLRPALDALAAHDGDAVVLASGDPGYFGIVRALRERGLDCVVLPAISSVAQAFARAGLPWDDAIVVSAHGRELRAAVNVCRAHPKVAVLTGPGQGPAEIGAALAGWPRRLLVAEDLGAPGERLTECTPANAAQREWSDPNLVLSLADTRLEESALPSSPPAQSPPVTNRSSTPPAPSDGDGESVINRLVLLQRHQSVDHESRGPFDDPTNPSSHTEATGGSPEGPRPGPGWCWPRWTGVGDEGWALPGDSFEHRDSMVTKPEVRALALARLGPRPGVLVWDVGAGSGSVAVECAHFGAAVIAVDRDPAQCARVTANARRHGAEVRVVGGAAPEALDGLPDPDAVFVGGGGLAVVSAVAGRRPARIVVALAAVQRAGPAMEALADAGYVVDGSLLQASRLAPLPDGAHRLAAANPVFLLWAALDHDHGPWGAP